MPIPLPFTAFTILLGSPFYLVLIALIIGAALAWFTYRKSSLAKNGLFRWPAWLLIGLRFLAFSLIAFLLLSPFVRTQSKEVEEPVIAVAVDQSRSVLLGQDSVVYAQQLQEQVNALVSELGDDFQVETFAFGENLQEEVNWQFDEPVTNISRTLQQLRERFAGENLGAVVVVSDGIYNQGLNPEYLPESLPPIYPIALGDTIPPQDVLIQDLQHNEIVYVGNDFPVVVRLAARGLSGEEVELVVEHEGNVVHRQDLQIDNEQWLEEQTVFLTADEPGLQRYTVRVSSLEGEVSNQNNVRDFFIEALESRRRILLAAAAPHPDLGALKASIERNEQYEVDVRLLSAQQPMPSGQELAGYHLAILHQLPSQGGQGTQLIQGLVLQEVPMFVITGTQTNFRQLTQLGLGVQAQVGGSWNAVLPVVNERFALFHVEEETQQLLKRLPPLQAPYGQFSLLGNQEVLLRQQIGQVQTDLPLLAFVNSGGQKRAFLLGEGFWRWRLHSYQLAGTHEPIDNLLSKLVQYLSLKADKRQFRLNFAQNIFYENRPLRMTAEVYNESYEPVTGADVTLVAENEEGQEYTFSFVESGTGYELRETYLPPGTYTYTASTTIGGTRHELTGEFVVKPSELEYLQTVANHAMLYNLAQKTGGELVYPSDIEALIEQLRNREDLVPVAYEEQDLEAMINLKWLFLLLLVFLGTEWFLRKFYGSY